MAVLTEEARLLASAKAIREFVGEISIEKADVRAAIAALDNFLENNRAAINNSIPEPAKSSLTVQQKIGLLAFVLMRRLEDGSDA
jgi:hypothetical protein